MKEILTPDICVVGAGTAGRTVAAAAVALGVSVVLIEKKSLGGDGQNAGCIPSKALTAASRQAQAIRDATPFGVKGGEPKTDFPAVMQHVREVIAAIAPNNSAARFTGLGVRVIAGEARFLDERTLTVENALIYARRFVVATGSRPAAPPIPNLQNVPYFTSETIFELKRLPSRLVVVGAGPTGLELAQAFHRLGSEVIVLEAGKALAGDDPELTALLMESLRAEGIDIREGAEIVRLARRGRTGVRVVLEGSGDFSQIDATHLLIATPRRPDIDQLGLKQARIPFDDGGIRVNRRLRTRNPRVYAIGDVIAGAHFTHWGAYQAGLVVRSILFRFGGKIRPEILPWVIFTDPELAHVGLGEADARRRYGRIRILRWPFAENERAHADRSTRGMAKIVLTRRGRIVGAEILGRDAGELIAPFVLAVAQGMNIRHFATAVFPNPSRSEAFHRAAASHYARNVESPWLKLVGRLLRRFG